MKRFTESHEWVELEGDIARIGITDYAQRELGEIVYVELPTAGKTVQAGQEVAVLESTKAAVDVYSPLSGKIIEVNKELATSPDIVNKSAENNGWLFKLKISSSLEFNTLMDEISYQKIVRNNNDT